jgi:hypothetical protein
MENRGFNRVNFTMKKIKTIFIPLFFILILQACYNDKEEIIYPASANCDTTSNVSYASAITPIINAHCLACHGSGVFTSSGGNLNLDGYSNISVPVSNGSLLKSIQHQAGVSPMPKNAQKLSDCNISIIKKWIDAGAPNN